MPRTRAHTPIRAASLLALLLSVGTCGPGGEAGGAAAQQPSSVATWTDLGALHRALSETGGFFDTDNLISNESSYLHVLGALDEMGVQGGAYIGVGPDQNFSYIAAIRPSVAFIVDVRRDNTLQHLLFKALFELAPTRIEYLSLLHGVAPPDDPSEWRDRSIEELVDWIDAQSVERGVRSRLQERVDSAVTTFGIELDQGDRATIRRFHDAFIDAGLGLRFTSLGRPPRWYYPTFRQLLLETDLGGRRANYLAAADGYDVLRTMQREDRVVPVVGDLGGEHALRAIGDEVRRRGETVSAFYTSNVEFYLFGGSAFRTYAENVAALPMAENSVLIRSYFPNQGLHPHAVSGYYSTQSLQTMKSFVTSWEAGRYTTYWSLVTRDAVDPRGAVGTGR